MNNGNSYNRGTGSTTGIPPAYLKPIQFGERYSLAGYAAGVCLRNEPNTITELNHKTIILFAERLMDEIFKMNDPVMKPEEVLQNLMNTATNLTQESYNRGPINLINTNGTANTEQKICIILGFYIGNNKINNLGNRLCTNIYRNKYGNNNQFNLAFNNPGALELLFILKACTNMYMTNVHIGGRGQIYNPRLVTETDYTQFTETVLSNTFDVNRYQPEDYGYNNAFDKILDYIYREC